MFETQDFVIPVPEVGPEAVYYCKGVGILGIHGTDNGTYGGPPDKIDRYPAFLQDLEYAEMSKSPGASTAECQSDLGRLKGLLPAGKRPAEETLTQFRFRREMMRLPGLSP
jgi:hypothetical protein